MNIDVHFHTCLTKGIPFDYAFFRQAAARARAVGMGAIIITDHLENAAFETIYTTLDAHHPYNGHYYLIDEVRFYPGVEVEVAEGPHLLVAGTRDEVLAFVARVKAGHGAADHVPVAAFFDRQAGLDLLNIVGHPCRPDRELSLLEPAWVARFDALDLNAKDLWRFGPQMRARVEALGATYGRPIVAGSDAHHFLQVGSLYNTIHQPFERIAELRALIRAGAYTLHVRPELSEWVERAQETKRAIKQARYGMIASKDD